MIRAFLAWWQAQLTELLPQRLRPQEGFSDALVVTLRAGTDAPAAGFARRQQSRDQPLGDFPLDPAGIAAAVAQVGRRPLPPVILRLPAFMVLEREVALPLAAESAPQSVLTYEMDRLTPFTADEIFWSWRIERRDPANKRLHLRVTLAAKAAVDDLVTALTEAGAAPAVLEGWPTPPAATRPPRIALGHTAATRPPRLTQALLGLCAVLALAVAVTPFITQSLALSRVEGRIATLKPLVAEAEALRRRATGSTGTDVLAIERARSGDALQALAAVTDSLPDDTYLTGFALHQRQLTIDGQSAGAAKLIGGLADNPLIRDPAFTAPVTHSEAGLDLFSIHAEFGS